VTVHLDVQSMHEHEHVVFTNSFGQHQLGWRGQLIDPDLDLSRFGTLPDQDRVDQLLGYRFHPEDLEHLANEMRHHAEEFTRLAEQYQALIDTGWELNRDPRTTPYGNVVNTSTDGDSFAPGPRGR